MIEVVLVFIFSRAFRPKRARIVNLAIILAPAIAYAHGGGGHSGGGGCGGGGGYHSSSGGHSSGGGGGHSFGGGGGHSSGGHSGGGVASGGHGAGGHVSSGGGHASGGHGGTRPSAHGPHAGGDTRVATRGGADVPRHDTPVGGGQAHDAGRTDHVARVAGDHGHVVHVRRRHHHLGSDGVVLDLDFGIDLGDSEIVDVDCDSVAAPDDADVPAPPSDDATPVDPTAPVDDDPVTILAACRAFPDDDPGVDQDGDDEPVPAEAYDTNQNPSCNEDSNVVGYRHCTPFAKWDVDRVPAFEVELGSNVRQLVDRMGTLDGHTFRLVGPGMQARDLAVTTTMRGSISVARYGYVGLEAEIGGLTSQATPMASGDATPATAVVAGGTLFGGVRATTGALRFGTEIAVGGRSITYGADSMSGSHLTDIEGAPVVELRARGQWWIHPFFAVGVSLGTSVIDRGEWSAGVGLTFATHAFSGR